MKPDPGPLRICGLRHSRQGSRERVAAEVDGDEVWFESADVPLAADPLALASAFLVPALHQGRVLESEAPLCPRWLEGVRELAAILNEWWGYPEIPPGPRAAAADPRPAAPGTALCFSGGVDSFYSLLAGGVQPDLLVLVHGFDVPLADEVRLAPILVTLRDVAARCGARAVLVQTNLREVPAFACVNWERSHGGALAAVGHLLAGSAGRFVISATYATDRAPPWGSHWRTDPLWSSERLQVVHCGAELRRAQKLLAIAEHPLARSHLRVCWENRSPVGNCSRCDKCLLTMLVLERAGHLAAFPVFEPPESFPRSLDALPHSRYVRTLQGLLDGELDAELRGALERLLERSAPSPAPAGLLARLQRRLGFREGQARGPRRRTVC